MTTPIVQSISDERLAEVESQYIGTAPGLIQL